MPPSRDGKGCPAGRPWVIRGPGSRVMVPSICYPPSSRLRRVHAAVQRGNDCAWLVARQEGQVLRVHTGGDTSAALFVSAPQPVQQGGTSAFRRLLAGLLFAFALVVAAVASPSPAQAAALLPVDLGTLGGSDSFSNAQNESGQVAGDSITSTGAQHAFLWSRAAGMADLGSLGGPATDSSANAVSNTGQVVGFSFLNVGISHAFSWTQSGGMV